MDTDSLFPILESCSEEEESCGTQSSVTEVFMAGTPPPESNHHGGVRVDPSAAATNAAAGDRQSGGTQLTREQWQAAEQLLNTHIPGDSLTDKALEAAFGTS